MASFAWACWDGGGNLTPSLGIARELTHRGHRTHFFGRPDMVTRVEAAGFRATELADAYAALDRYAFHPMPTVFGYTSSGLVGEELVQVVGDDDPDVVVIDAMFSAALAVAPRFQRPTAVALHTFLYRLLGMWHENFLMQSASRERAGFDRLPTLDVLWGERDLLHVNALRSFDGPSANSWTNVRHGAPVLSAEPRAVPARLPLGSGEMPLVLVSFSTVAEQRSPVMLQRTLDALAPLPVRVVATTGAIVRLDEIDAPANAHVLSFADHEPLMSEAVVVVGHGGHGTTMRSLRQGTPVVCIPAKGGDQAPIGELLETWGAGRALPGDASVEQIRRAVELVLADPAYRAEARRRSTALAGCDGAGSAADALESLLVR